MPFLVQHKCHELDHDFTDFAVIRSTLDGKPMTRLVCPKCREDFVVLTKGTFEEARVTPRIPGLILPGGHL